MEDFLGGLAGAPVGADRFSSSSESQGVTSCSGEEGDAQKRKRKRKRGAGRPQTSGLVPVWERKAQDSGVPVLALSSDSDSGGVQELPGQGARVGGCGRAGGITGFEIEIPPLPAPDRANNETAGAVSLAVQLTRQRQKERLKELMESPKEDEIEVHIEDIAISTSEESEGEDEASPGRRTSMPPSQSGPLEADADMVVLKVQSSKASNSFKVKMDEGLGKLFDHYEKTICADMEPPKGGFKFSFDGERLRPGSTPSDLDMEADDIIEVNI